jgi:N-acyl-D-amino-acid deacylase
MAALFTAATATTTAQSPTPATLPADLRIDNARIIDGTGNAFYLGGLTVRGGKIETIYRTGTPADQIPPATTIVDAAGLVLAPGFIDVHTHADDDLFRLPLAENFIRNGVTTLVIGNCGGSPTDIAKYFARLTEIGCAANVAALIGHNSILRAVGDVGDAPLSPEQMARAQEIVRQAMLDGAVGLSTGLIYTPGTYSPTEEIIELAKVAGQFGGIYASHMRSESTDILTAIDEALRIGRESGCRVQISHFKLPRDMASTLGGAQTTLGKVMAARAAGQEVWIDQYPYTASSTTINVMLPDHILEKGRDKAAEYLATPEGRAAAKAQMHQDAARRQRTDLSYAVFAGTKNSGKSVKQVAEMRIAEKQGELLGATPPAVTLDDQFDVVIDTFLAGGASMVFHTMDEREVKDIMAHPLVSVASDSGVRQFNSGQPHPRGYGTNTRVLGRYVRELKVITLEDAIRKMTSQPATAFNLADRGQLRPGFAADLVLFDPQTIADKATFDQPHQYPVGIQAVYTNGVLVFNGTEMTGAKPGTPLKRN